MDYFEIRDCLDDLEVEIDSQSLDLSWSLPTQPNRGILTTNAGFQLAKDKGISPPAAAEMIASQLNKLDQIDQLQMLEFKAEGPFVNVYVSELGLSQLLMNPDSFDAGLPEDARKVMFEYIGANVAKQLHIGHMRNLNIGDALRQVLQLKYPNLITDNHWGDWGVQFGVLLWAYKQQLDQSTYDQDPLAELQRLYVWGNAQEGHIEDWAELVRAEFKKLEAGDRENTELWQQFLAVSKQELKQDLQLLDVPPTDLEQGESYYEDWMEQLVEFCDQHQLWQIEGEARYIDFEQLAADWTELDSAQRKNVAKLGRAYFVSSQGYTTYVFRDVAARLQWAHQHEIDLAITVTDNRQEHNFNQAFAFIAYLASTDQFKQRWGQDTAERLDRSQLKHIGYGRLSLTTGTVSSRAGDTLLLRDAYRQVYESVQAEFDDRQLSADDETLHAVTVAALKWQDLKTDPNTDIVIDPQTIVSFEGDTGVYQLYTVARLYSAISNVTQEPADTDVSSELLNDTEQNILTALLSLHEHRLQSADNYDVSGLVNALGSLSRSINGWYEQHHIASASGVRQQTMLAFASICHQAFSDNLKLLGIQTLTKL